MAFPPRNLRPVKTCLLDIDGTLLDSQNRIPNTVYALMSQAIALGLRTALVTSRGVPAIPPVLKQLPESLAHQPFVAYQGALVGALDQDGSLTKYFSITIPRSLASEVVNLAEARDLSIAWYCGSHWFTRAQTPLIKREATLTQSRPTIVPSFVDLPRPHKIILFTPHRDAAHLATTLPQKKELTVYATYHSYVEITPRDADKGTGAETLAEVLGINLKQAISIGDGVNDLPLFAKTALCAAMLNAPDEVKNRANFILPSNEDGGVSRFLEMWIASLGRGYS